MTIFYVLAVCFVLSLGLLAYAAWVDPNRAGHIDDQFVQDERALHIKHLETLNKPKGGKA
jgi:hypothetical protein